MLKFTPRALAGGALVAVAWTFAAGVAVQLVLAGRAVFVAPSWWARHRDFVHLFEWLSPVAVALAYGARSARRTKWLAWATVALLMAQYVTDGFRSRGGHAGWAALHPLGGALLLWVAIELARGAQGDVRGAARA